MLWETFSAAHVASLILGLATIIIIYMVLVKKSRRAQILTLFVIALATTASVLYATFSSSSIKDNLPLELWSLSALLMPYAVITRKNWCCNLLLLWPIQSLILLVFNYRQAGMNVFSFEFVIYFFTHLLIFAIPLILFWLKLVKRDHKFMKYSILITIAVYTAVHFVNVALDTNYLCSRAPIGNGFLSFLRTFIPEYWYMYLMIPVFVLYLVQWYLPEILDYRRKRKRLRSKLRVLEEYYDEYEDEYIDEIIEEKYGD